MFDKCLLQNLRISVLFFRFRERKRKEGREETKEKRAREGDIDKYKDRFEERKIEK